MKVEKGEIKKLKADERQNILLNIMKDGAPIEEIWEKTKEFYEVLLPDKEKQRDRFDRDFAVLKNNKKIRQVAGGIWLPESEKKKREPPKYVKVRVKLEGTMPYLGGFNQLMAWWTSEDKRPQYGLAEKDDYLAIEKNKKDELLVRAGQLRGCLRDTAQTIGMSGMAFVSRVFIKGPMKLQGELAERLIPVNVSNIFAGGKPISTVSYHEAVYPGWQLETEIEFPTRDISVEDFEDLIKRAGNKGLGASHSLGYGTFEVIEFEVLGEIGKQ